MPCKNKIARKFEFIDEEDQVTEKLIDGKQKPLIQFELIKMQNCLWKSLLPWHKPQKWQQSNPDVMNYTNRPCHLIEMFYMNRHNQRAIETQGKEWQRNKNRPSQAITNLGTISNSKQIKCYVC